MAIILQCLIIKHFVTHLPDIASSAMFLFVRRIRGSCQNYKMLTVSGLVVVIALSSCVSFLPIMLYILLYACDVFYTELCHVISCEALLNAQLFVKRAL